MTSSNIASSGLWGKVRQVLREFFRGGRKTVSSLAVTIDRQAGIQKLVAQIRALRRERQQVLVAIGKKAYSLHTRGKVRNRDILEDCLRIDEIEAEVKRVEAEIEEIRRQAKPEDELLVDLEDEGIMGEEEEVVEVAEAAPAAEAGGEGEAEESVAQLPAGDEDAGSAVPED